jgi:hypothetical protein
VRRIWLGFLLGLFSAGVAHAQGVPGTGQVVPACGAISGQVGQIRTITLDTGLRLCISPTLGLYTVHSTVSSNTTLDGTAQLWPCDATLGPIVITVPFGSLFPNQIWDVKKIDVTAHACTIQMSGSDTLDGSSSWALSVPNQDITINNSQGTTIWYIR